MSSVPSSIWLHWKRRVPWNKSRSSAFAWVDPSDFRGEICLRKGSLPDGADHFRVAAVNLVH
jgi:hypothetical protein